MSSPPPIPCVTVSAATPSPPKPPLASVESLGFSSPEEGKRRRRRRSGAEAGDDDNGMGEEEAAGGVLRLTPEHLRSLPTDAARWEAVAAALSGLADVGSRLARVEGLLGRPGMAPLLFGSASHLAAADGGGEEVEDLLLGKSAARSGFQACFSKYCVHFADFFTLYSTSYNLGDFLFSAGRAKARVFRHPAQQAGENSR